MRIALISDTHLSARSPECVANWHAARRAVARLSPDITINLGDITLDGQTHPEEIEFAADLARQWPTPMLCVPGNHDVGDGSGEAPLNAAARSVYAAAFGPSQWMRSAGNWMLLGIDAQLLGTDTAEERAQWDWLEVQVHGAESPGQIAIFLHRPVLRPGFAEQSRRGRYVAAAAAERLLSGSLRSRLRLVVSGHTHQHLDATNEGVRHVWMPSSAFYLPDHMQVRIGEKVVGIGVLELGDTDAAFDLWCPDGMFRHDVSVLQAFQE